MTMKLTDDVRRQALDSVTRYCAEHDLDIGNLEAVGLVDFILKEIAPSAYNAGVADAQAFLHERVADLEAACYEPEFAYWPRTGSVRRKPG
jgi:uncharacterized protein (DUF2164 family)